MHVKINAKIQSALGIMLLIAQPRSHFDGMRSECLVTLGISHFEQREIPRVGLSTMPCRWYIPPPIATRIDGLEWCRRGPGIGGIQLREMQTHKIKSKKEKNSQACQEFHEQSVVRRMGCAPIGTISY